MATARIMAQIGLDGRGFRAGLSQAEKTATAFANRMAGRLAAAFSFAAIGYTFKKTLDAASRINDMSKALGISTSEFQELEYAAKQTGTTIEAFQKAILTTTRMQRQALTEGEGGKTGDTFKRLGISFAELKSKDPLALFYRLSELYKSGAIGIANMGDMLRIFGRGNIEILTPMQEGIAGLRDRFRSLGLTIKDDVITQLDELNDSLHDSLTKWEQLKMMGAGKAGEGADLLPTGATAAYGFASEFLSGFLKWVKPDVKSASTFGDVISKAIQAWEAPWEERLEDDAEKRDKRAIARAETIKRLRSGDLSAAANEAMAADAKAGKALSFKPATDELAKIGGFVGGTGTQQIGILRNIERQVSRGADATEDVVRELDDL